MVLGKPVSVWMSMEEKKEVKQKAEKEKRSVSNFIKMKVFGDNGK